MVRGVCEVRVSMHLEDGMRLREYGERRASLRSETVSDTVTWATSLIRQPSFAASSSATSTCITIFFARRPPRS